MTDCTRQLSCISSFCFYLDNILDLQDLLDNVRSSTCSAQNFDFSEFHSKHDFLFFLSSSSAEDMEIAVKNCIVCHPEYEANSAGIVLAAIERSLTKLLVFVHLSVTYLFSLQCWIRLQIVWHIFVAECLPEGGRFYRVTSG